MGHESFERGEAPDTQHDEVAPLARVEGDLGQRLGPAAFFSEGRACQ
jgi:hypothetical protein